MDTLIAGEPISKTSKGFILDSYPIKPEQASFLDVSDEVALEKLKAEGKAKFKRSFAQERIDAFRSPIGPVVYYYPDDLQTIDANKDLSNSYRFLIPCLETGR